MKLIHRIFGFAIFGLLFFGCKPDPTFPSEPILKFYKFMPQDTGSEELTVVFSFTDGDGDIGLSPTDVGYNFMLTAYAPNANGIFVVMPGLPPQDSLTYDYRVPPLTTESISLEGDIYITFPNKWWIGRDTLQFNAFLLDKAQHRSNCVRTETVFLTQ